jgi:hypothetical protein
MNEEQHNLGDKKNSGFGMPDGYFDSFDARLMKKIELQEELSEFPTLSSIKKENPFFVDASYFEDLPSAIADKIHAQKAGLNWLDKLKSILFRPAFAFSFGLALIVTVVFVYKSQSIVTEEVCNDLACLSKEEILNSTDFGALTVEELMNEIPDNSTVSDADTVLDKELINDLIENPELISGDVENLEL